MSASFQAAVSCLTRLWPLDVAIVDSYHGQKAGLSVSVLVYLRCALLGGGGTLEVCSCASGQSTWPSAIRTLVSAPKGLSWIPSVFYKSKRGTGCQLHP